MALKCSYFTLLPTGIPCGKPAQHPYLHTHGEQHSYPANVNFSCDPGFILAGENTSQCLANGSWSRPSPSCVAVRCPVLEVPEHATLSSGNRTFTSMISVQCLSGYELDTSWNVSCMSNAAWSNPHLPHCTPVQCNGIQAADHSEIIQADYTYQGMLMVQCVPGYYHKAGSTVRTCLANRTWSGQNVQCECECRHNRMPY